MENSPWHNCSPSVQNSRGKLQNVVINSTAVDNNWHISDARVGGSFSKDQQDLIRQIFLGLHSQGYAQQVLG